MERSSPQTNPAARHCSTIASKKRRNTSSPYRSRIRHNLRLAEDLGATTKAIEGEAVASTLAQVVRAEHATTVVLAHTPPPGWRRFFRESLPDQLLRLLEGVDLHLVETRSDPR